MRKRQPPKARAKIPKRTDGFKSEVERLWADAGYKQVVLALPEFEGAVVYSNLYEPITFRVPGGRYTPDFQILLVDGRLIFVEVKESKYQGSYRDARAKIRSAASLYPWYTFVMAFGKRRPQTWSLEIIVPDAGGWHTGIENGDDEQEG